MQKNIKITNTTIFLLLMFPMFLISSFNSNSLELKILGVLSILFLFGISALLLFRHLLLEKSINVNIFKLIIPILLLSIFFTLSYFVDPNSTGAGNLFKFFGAMCLFLFFSYIEWTKIRIKITFLFSILMLVIMPFFTDLAFSGPHYAFILFFVLMSNTNTILKFIISIICLYIIYLTDARAVLLLVFGAAITYLLWNLISKNRVFFYAYFIGVITITMSFIFIYPRLIYFQWFQSLNLWAIKVTGARLNSGRDIIWAQLTDAILLKPFLGYGLGASTKDVIDANLSAHNLYIQIAFQSGLIALFLFIALTFTIWSIYYISRKERITRLSASFFVGILIYSSFEVILIQNKMDTATMFWLIISIGISMSIHRRKPKLPA